MFWPPSFRCEGYLDDNIDGTVDVMPKIQYNIFDKTKINNQRPKVKT